MSTKDEIIRLANELQAVAATYEEAVTPPVSESSILTGFVEYCCDHGMIYYTPGRSKKQAIQDIKTCIEGNKIAYKELNDDYQHLHELCMSYKTALQNAGIAIPVINPPPSLDFAESDVETDDEDEDEQEGEQASW
jgi:hypothetical protein